MDKYLVITGNEYGFDLSDVIDLNFVDLEKAEETYTNYIEEYGCAAIYKVLDNKLELVKIEQNF